MNDACWFVVPASRNLSIPIQRFMNNFGSSINMRFFTLLLATLLVTPVTAFAKEARPTGLNCSLSAPPASSGEDAYKRTKLLIYPRAKDIGSNYTGCQSVWAPLSPSWSLLTLVYLENGQIVRLWSAKKEDDPAERCRYENRLLVKGDSNTCPSLDLIPIKSLPPGCFRKIHASVEAMTDSPKECRYE